MRNVAPIIALAVLLTACGSSPVPTATPTAAPPSPMATGVALNASSAAGTAVPSTLTGTVTVNFTVDFLLIRDSVKPGETNSAIFRTTRPGAMCSIIIRPTPGSAAVRELEPKPAQSDGVVSWTWHVEPDAAPGMRAVDVTCTTQSESAHVSTKFTVMPK